jgi:hypothetical protein
VLVDVNELYCPKCGRPLPSVLPLDEDQEIETGYPRAGTAGADAERLSRLEIGFSIPSAPLEESPAPEPILSPAPPPSSQQKLSQAQTLLGSVAKGVVRDKRDSLDKIANRYSMRERMILGDRDQIPSIVMARMARTLIFAIAFAIFALPIILSLPSYEIEGVSYGYGFIKIWAYLVLGGVAFVSFIYIIIYFAVYRRGSARKPPDGS